MPVYVDREAPKVFVSLSLCFKKGNKKMLKLFSLVVMLQWFLCVYVKLWRRIYSEATLEASLLAEKWKLVLAGLAFQVL